MLRSSKVDANAIVFQKHLSKYVTKVTNVLFDDCTV